MTDMHVIVCQNVLACYVQLEYKNMVQINSFLKQICRLASILK